MKIYKVNHTVTCRGCGRLVDDAGELALYPDGEEYTVNLCFGCLRQLQNEIYRYIVMDSGEYDKLPVPGRE